MIDLEAIKRSGLCSLHDLIGIIIRLEAAERRVAELEAREERRYARALDALAEINVSLGLTDQ